MDIPVELYAPYGAPPNELKEDFLKNAAQSQFRKNGYSQAKALQPAWIALVEILNRIEKQPYHWPVGRTIFQKIAYISTREGLPTGLNYQKGSFGPFAANLKNLTAQLINNNLLMEERMGKMFMVKVGPGYNKVRDQYANQLSLWENIIDKTMDLFLRINTNQAEIVATVIYTVDQLINNANRKPTELEVLNSVMQWKQKRRPPLNKQEVASNIRNLGMLRWLSTIPSPEFNVITEDIAS